MQQDSEITGRDGMCLPTRHTKISQGDVERSQSTKSGKTVGPDGTSESRRAIRYEKVRQCCGREQQKPESEQE